MGSESKQFAVGEQREGCGPGRGSRVTWDIQAEGCGAGRGSRRWEAWPWGAELKQKVTTLLSISPGALGLWELGSQRSNTNFSAERNPQKWLTLGHKRYPGDPTLTLSFVSQVPSLPLSYRFPLLQKDVTAKAVPRAPLKHP